MHKSKADILIVDDEIYILEILQSTLKGAGYHCVTAENVEAAIALLQTQHFNLALTDIRMPGRSGTELLQHIRKSHPNMVVLMITGLDTAATAIENIRLGAYDYIIKPFNLDQVLVSVDRALEKQRLEVANRDYQKYLEQMAEERAAETRRLFYSTTQVLMAMLELKNPFRAGYVKQVAEMSRHVARDLKMTEDGVRKVYLAALLHDVGMLVVKDTVLSKQEKLTLEEQLQIREHTSIAEGVLKPILTDEEVVKHIRHHHERYDGTGYPDGLKGNIIPLGARIISVVEAFAAMTRRSLYREPLTVEMALKELHRCSSSQFDPQVVSVFEELYEQEFRNMGGAPPDA